VVEHERLWTQIAHGKNQLNDYRGMLWVPYEILIDDFGVSPEVVNAFPKVNSMHLKTFNFAWESYQKLKQFKKRLFK
jgi:hypothetical protein